MIKLDFKIDEKELQPKYLKLIKPDRYICLVITCFLMPVRFQIHGKDVFYNKKAPKFGHWFTMPLLDVVTMGLGHIEILPQKKKTEWWLHESGGKVHFKMMSGNKVKVTFTSHDEVFYVDYNELLQAFMNFRERVLKFLNERVPQLQDHSYWGPWLKGEAHWEVDKGVCPGKKKVPRIKKI